MGSAYSCDDCDLGTGKSRKRRNLTAVIHADLPDCRLIFPISLQDR